MNKQINITDIPKDKEYEGYLWMSDSDKPLQSQMEIVTKLKIMTNNSNPFIVEGQLYIEKEKRSYSIKYVDGKHVVVEYDLNNIPTNWIADKEDKLFISNRRLDEISKIKFRQYWKPEKDELCEGMETLVPAGYVFVGFEYNKKKEEK